MNERISLACDFMEFHNVNIAVNENIYDDDNVMRASVWFESFEGLFLYHNPWYMWGRHDNKEWDLNGEYMFPRFAFRVWCYKHAKFIMIDQVQIC